MISTVDKAKVALGAKKARNENGNADSYTAMQIATAGRRNENEKAARRTRTSGIDDPCCTT
ncbi:hypothetical protein X777_01083 [Ooceraea biroi]|uniref:Uncharacterized protein n=1 Tax=Ooceraea biroi TaxID=2015173 RepID=A0A026VSW5_OOCBI|nr:hypothetical protein X777_01083 [Ooceraea biroi]